MSALQFIPIEKLKAGDNPRGEVNEESEAFVEFCKTVEQHGVIQPILVTPSGDDFTVIAGHRRRLAAIKTKKTEVPALIAETEEDARFALAMIENIHREDLSAIDEARALRRLRNELDLTQLDAAKVLGKSERWARYCEKILRLPERTQEAFDEKVLPLERIDAIAKIADAAPVVADALADAATTGELKDQVRDAIAGGRAAEAVDLVARSAAEKPNPDGSSPLGCMVPLNGFGSRYEIPKEQLVLAGVPPQLMSTLIERLEVGAKIARQASFHIGYFDRVVFDGSDVDAANSYGALLSIDGRKYITDAEWLGDRFLSRLNELITRGEERLAEQGRGGSTNAGDGPAGDQTPEEEEAAKQLRREEREQEAERRAAIRANNLELGQRAGRILKAPSLTLEEEKLLALKVVGNRATELAASGIIYCYHDYQAVDGTKLTYASGASAGEDLIAQIKGSKKKGEPLGHALRALALSQFADEECVAMSSRSGYAPTMGSDADVPGLLEAIAEKRKILPDAVREGIEAKRQIRAEKAEIVLLAEAKGSRAKTGVKLSVLLERGYIPQEMIDDAVSSKWLKEHEGEEFSYTITAAGTKRLEKLKAAEKERQAA